MPRWAVAIAVVGGLVAYLGTLLAGIETWSRSPDQQHGFLVIPIALLLLYLRRGDFPSGSATIDLRGFALLAAAAGLRFAGERFHYSWMDMWSLPLWIGGAVWLLGGWRIFRWAAPAIVFLFFMAPLPGMVQTAAGYPLQRLAATAGGWTLQLLGQPAFIAGTTILLGDNVLDIERACAGLRMFHGMLAVAFGWSLFNRYQWPRFLAMIAIAPLVAIVVNVLRITATGLLFQWVDGSTARAFAHDWAGILMIPTGALVFFAIDGLADRTLRWNAARPGRWPVTAAASIVSVFLLVGGGYALHQTQRQAAIDSVLTQARKLSGEDSSAEDRLRAADLYQRYLSARPGDAPVLSELGELNIRLGPQRWRRAARLFELAWQAEPTRADDALTSLHLLRRNGDWQTLWETSQKMLPRITGTQRVVVMRLRTLAIQQLTRSSTVGLDVEPMLAACRQAASVDDQFFEHMWQQARLTRAHPEIAARHRDDAPALAPAGADPQSQEPASEQDPAQGDAEWQAARETLSSGDLAALAIVDRAIADHPEAARPLLYRVSLLEAMAEEVVVDQPRQAIEQQIDQTLNDALALVERTFPAPAAAPGAEAASAESPATEPVSSDQQTAAAAYLLTGQRAMDQGHRDRARRFFERSRSLNPRNYQIYLLLAQLLPRDEPSQKIALFRDAIEQCGSSEVTLLLPLAEAYIADGRQDEAEALLERLESALPRMAARDRAKIQIMLAMTRASGLAQRDEPRPAAELLAAALGDPSVAMQRRYFSNLFGRAQFQLGALYRTLQRDAAAAAAFRRGAEFLPDAPAYHVDAAMAYERAGNLDLALTSYRKAASGLAGRNPDILLQVAHVQIARARRQSAGAANLEEPRALIRTAVRAGADPERATALLAESYVAEEDLAGALRVLNERLQQSPDAAPLLFSRALVHQMSDDLPSAVADVARYEQTEASAADALLLKVLVYQRAGKWHEALKALESVGDELTDDELKPIRTQLALGLFQQGRFEDGTERLIQLAGTYPKDLPIQRVAADIFADLRMDDQLQQAEQRLRQLEGETGTLWRATRAARLIRTATTRQQLEQAEQLVQQLETMLPEWAKTNSLRGQLAEASGQWHQALRAYEAAWSAGQRDAALAGRILTALNRTGQSQRAESYIDQLEDLVPQSTSLFDRAMPQYVRGNRAEYVLNLARRWVQEDPTAENHVRLGQTLMTVAASQGATQRLGSEQAVEAALDEAEQAFDDAIAQQPDNLDAWIAAFQLQSQIRQDRPGALRKLQALSEKVEIDPLRRTFVLAQLYRAIGEDARAGALFNESVALAEPLPLNQRQSVILTAAGFFADRRGERAIELCRSIVSEHPQAVEAKRVLIGLLANTGQPQAISEALQLQQSLHQSEALGADEAARLRARLLMMRADLGEAPLTDQTNPANGSVVRTSFEPPPAPQGSAPTRGSVQAGGSAPADRAAAIELLSEISAQSAEDAFLLAQLHAQSGNRITAFNLFEKSLRLDTVTPRRLVTFLEFCVEHEAEEERFTAIADERLEQLAEMPDQASEWLSLKLARIAHRGPSTAHAAAPTTPPAGEAPSAARVLRQFVDSFLPPYQDDRFADQFFELAEGLAKAERASLLPQAVDMLPASPDRRDALARAAASAAMRLSRVPEVGHQLSAMLRQTIAPDDQTDGQLLATVGDAMYLCGQTSLAEPYYRAALAQDPQNATAINNLAIVLAEQGKAEQEAERLARRVIELEPENADRIDTLLVIALLQQRTELAGRVAARLTNQQGATVLLHRATLALRQGDAERAEILWDRARDANVQAQLLASYDREMFEELKRTFDSPTANAR